MDVARTRRVKTPQQLLNATGGNATNSNGVGNGIKDAADGVGEGVKDAAEGVGEGVKDAAEGVGNGVKDAVDGVEDAVDGNQSKR